MGKLTNQHSSRVGVYDDADSPKEKHKLVHIEPGRSAEVKRDFSKHPMVKAGWLKFEGGKAKAEPKAPEGGSGDDPITVEDVTGEDGVFTVQASDGVTFQPAKNQVREDGTLTGGGMKAYEEAKAKAEAEGGEE
ncbi:hypothetical protein EKK97_14000 [Billgrantia tianxiuensis]|uniref:Uncharacterized protein n=1 Tax=Billgrantia tianxiuensis TaxID=2497861 RepID=A0A6I6SII3_9GAMM|nr:MULTISPECIES: hypothetical protein [Halomonas]MCE8034611.1 hypothetical protein [Halomonas sp. MCCC 1A11057]QHC50478.1 hypothetical protein EKK97_14000 [Halomonas tianxiuensis]